MKVWLRTVENVTNGGGGGGGGGGNYSLAVYKCDFRSRAAHRFPPMRGGTRSSECFVRWPFKTPARETRRALIDWFVSRLLFIFRRSSKRI
jgi:hypothetical protein